MLGALAIGERMDKPRLVSAFDVFKEKFARIVKVGRVSDGFEIINPKPCSDDCVLCVADSSSKDHEELDD